jgi:hypothetical protein
VRSSKWVVLVVLICLVGIGSAGGYHIYQKHLSGDVKRLLLAANDDHASMMEVHQYMAQARPLERTQRDREVVGELEDGLALYATVQEDQQKDQEEYQATIRYRPDALDENDECFGNFNKLARLSQQYQREDIAGPPSLKASMTQEIEVAKACLERQRQASKSRSLEEQKDGKLAVDKLNDVRKAIGIAPLKTSK